MPEPKQLNDEMERRFLNVSLRAQLREDTKKPVIIGSAVVYDQETVIGGWFREKIAAGAFTRVLSEKPDVIGAFNHDWNYVLGRTAAGTLRLIDTAKSLDYEIDINPDDPEAMSVYAKVQRGDVKQSSFAWTARKQEWTEPPPGSNELPLRTVTEISQLYDVSPVTFPAYPQTTANVRSQAESLRQVPLPDPEQAAPGGAETLDEDLVAHQKMQANERKLIAAQEPPSKE